MSIISDSLEFAEQVVLARPRRSPPHFQKMTQKLKEQESLKTPPETFKR